MNLEFQPQKNSEESDFIIDTPDNEKSLEESKNNASSFKEKHDSEKKVKDSDLESQINIQAEKNIHELFTMHPELGKIGTEQQYFEYLKTIFPEANEQIKSLIFKHTTSKSIDLINSTDHVTDHAMFFSAGEYAKGAKFRNTLYCKLNIHKLAHAGGSVVYWDADKIKQYKNAGYDGAYGSYKNTIGLEGKGLDAFRAENPGKTDEEILRLANVALYSPGLDDVTVEKKFGEIVVFNMDQVFILGSEKDIAGFGEWVKKVNKDK